MCFGDALQWQWRVPVAFSSWQRFGSSPPGCAIVAVALASKRTAAMMVFMSGPLFGRENARRADMMPTDYDLQPVTRRLLKVMKFGRAAARHGLRCQRAGAHDRAACSVTAAPSTGLLRPPLHSAGPSRSITAEQRRRHHTQPSRIEPTQTPAPTTRPSTANLESPGRYREESPRTREGESTPNLQCLRQLATLSNR